HGGSSLPPRGWERGSGNECSQLLVPSSLREKKFVSGVVARSGNESRRAETKASPRAPPGTPPEFPASPESALDLQPHPCWSERRKSSSFRESGGRFLALSWCPLLSRGDPCPHHSRRRKKTSSASSCSGPSPRSVPNRWRPGWRATRPPWQ